MSTMSHNLLESAQRVQDNEGRQYHIALAPGEVAENILLVGDPERANKVALKFESLTLTRENREFISHTGVYRGLPVTVLGTGISAENMEIAVIELCQCTKAPVMIRCGSSGSLAPHIELGDLVIAQAALRAEQTTSYFVEAGFPAYSHYQVVASLVAAAKSVNVRHHVGITATAAGFYGAQARAIPGFPLRYPQRVEELKRQGVSNLEMEAAALLTLAAFRGFRAGVVCAIYADRCRDVFIAQAQADAAEQACIEVGLQALWNVRALDAQHTANEGPWAPEIPA